MQAVRASFLHETGVVVALRYVPAEDVFARCDCGSEEENNELLGRTDVSSSWFWWGK
jgi:hypothetical protein